MLVVLQASKQTTRVQYVSAKYSYVPEKNNHVPICFAHENNKYIERINGHCTQSRVSINDELIPN